MKTNTFKIDGFDKQFTVRELKVKEVLGLLGSVKESKLSDIEAFMDVIKNEFLPLAGNVQIEDLEEMAFSDIQLILDKFMEVNDAFFVLARKTGMSEFIDNLKTAIVADFGAYVVASSKRAMSTS
jgi:hypothetical protein